MAPEHVPELPYCVWEIPCHAPHEQEIQCVGNMNYTDGQRVRSTPSMLRLYWAPQDRTTLWHFTQGDWYSWEGPELLYVYFSFILWVSGSLSSIAEHWSDNVTCVVHPACSWHATLIVQVFSCQAAYVFVCDFQMSTKLLRMIVLNKWPYAVPKTPVNQLPYDVGKWTLH